MVLCLKEAMSGKYLISSEWKKCEIKENIRLRESAQEKDYEEFVDYPATEVVMMMTQLRTIIVTLMRCIVFLIWYMTV